VSPKYSLKTAKKICARLAKGQTIQEIVAQKGMPSLDAIIIWRTKHEEFDALIRVAQESKADILADEALAMTRRVMGITLACSLCQGKGTVLESRKIKTKEGDEHNEVSEEYLRFEKVESTCPACFGTGHTQDHKALVQALDKYQKGMHWTASRLRAGVYGDHLKPEPEAPAGLAAKIEIHLHDPSEPKPRQIIEGHAKEIISE